MQSFGFLPKLRTSSCLNRWVIASHTAGQMDQLWTGTECAAQLRP